MATVPTGSFDPDDDEAALYAGLSHEAAPQLASVHELRTELAAATQERETLESQLQALQAENRSRRDSIQDLTRRACVLLATARLELRRMDEELDKVGRVGKRQRGRT